jgi:alpha-mannosidase
MDFLFLYKRIYFVGLATLAMFFNPSVFAQANFGETTSLAWRIEPFYLYRKDGKQGLAMTIMLREQMPNGSVNVEVECNSINETTTFQSGDTVNKFLVLLPAEVGVNKATTANVTITAGDKKFFANIPIPVKKQWTVFIYPHSHVDIGYTGLQEDVEKIHVRNIDIGIDIAKKTQKYPEGSRFIWNTEATWVVDAYLKKATGKQKQSFFEAVRRGWVQIDAGYANIDNTTCSDEELMHFFKKSNEIEKQTKVPITTMVQVDLPGAAWGLVTSAVQNGVTGLISFPNNYDLRKIFEHKPFYWKGPDGQSKILFLQGYPYGIGYTIKGSKYGLAKLQTYSGDYDRVSTDHPLQNFVDAFLFKELDKLETEKSPYDFFVMTWSMADNCVIDADLPEAVKLWNEKYAYPKLVIAGAKEILSAYEKKYKNIIPEYSGDFTEFWTNGLGSDAAHVGMGRRAKENLVQAETIASLLNNPNFSNKKADSAWENILLSAEHTWGYQNPGAPLAKVIEKKKASFFSDAEEQSIALLKSFDDLSVINEQYAIVNTLSWDRDGIVTLSAEQSKLGDKVIEMSSANAVPSQRLSTGELIFQTKTIPALTSRMYKVVAGASPKNNSLVISNTILKNNFLSVSIDTVTGNIKSIVERKSKYDFVLQKDGLNSYYYLPGVFNGKGHPYSPMGAGPVTITIKENGPLLISLLICSKAPGVNWLRREVKLLANDTYIQFQNTFDKIGTRKKEGIHFGFAFNLPGAVSHLDAPLSVIVPEKDQLYGANRNWMTFQRWIDISNDNKGITWTAIESPLIEWGKISGNILDGAQQFDLWKKELKPTQTLYSWPLNNHWNTNFPLEQSGIISNNYAVFMHGKYDPVIANRFGMEQQRPLIAISAKNNLIENSLVRISNPRIIISSLKKDNQYLLVRLRSFSDKSERVKLEWRQNKPRLIKKYITEEVPFEMVGNEITLLPYGTETLYVSFKQQEKNLSNK